MEKEIIICRCEDVTLADIRKHIGDGCCTTEEIKRFTRAGMGPCQGRSCQRLIAQELAAACDLPLEDILTPPSRPPAAPVKLGVLGGDGK